jgi:phage gpG-like protein
MSDFEAFVRKRYLELLKEMEIAGKGAVELNLNLTKQSKRGTRNTTDTLRVFGGKDSLIKNIKVTATKDGKLTFEADRPYAAIHEYGGTIIQKRDTAFGRKTKAYTATIRIKARPYLAPALKELADDEDEFINDFFDEIANEYNK